MTLSGSLPTEDPYPCPASIGCFCRGAQRVEARELTRLVSLCKDSSLYLLPLSAIVSVLRYPVTLRLPPVQSTRRTTAVRVMARCTPGGSDYRDPLSFSWHGTNW
jgi:hypothetical protein